jgi:hypothetical protein
MRKLVMGAALVMVLATSARAEVQKVTVRADGMC